MTSPSAATVLRSSFRSPAHMAVLAALLLLLAAPRPTHSSSSSSHGDPVRFNVDDEHTVTTTVLFNSTRQAPLPPPHGHRRSGKAVVRRLLAALRNRTTTTTTRSRHVCRGVGAGTATGTGDGGVVYYGLTRCAAGTSCEDCRRCLRGAVAAVARAYNGSAAGMQVRRLSCMARYESHPLYSTASLQQSNDHRQIVGGAAAATGGRPLNYSASTPLPTPPAPAPPPGGHTTPPPPSHPPPAAENNPPPPGLHAAPPLPAATPGTLENGKEVAVKKLRDSKRNQQELEREIYVVANLCHKNLVRFLGYCLEDEACFHSQKLEWAAWFNIIKGIARGLRFLHNKGIIHRDLKPHNVLLDENFNPKIADFDLMRMCNKEKTHESTEKIAGTLLHDNKWNSARVFFFTDNCGVHAFVWMQVWQHWTEKRVGDIVDGDLCVDGQNEHALRQALRCVHVALLCVQSDRARRPTMGQVIAMLSIDDGKMMELQEPSLPGYVVFRPTAASGPIGYRVSDAGSS
ncbi:hypothetical protein HU200_027042 [Digitaria exilis]|uniref:non-specific serine/threonine protein kinase n=1 Tax=Digitaria exilis TaxID=1010633 RepID=A0A835ETT1_9POAL|nr:hypothetical protein HU200_027042 [Digitaria exilis]